MGGDDVEVSGHGGGNTPPLVTAAAMAADLAAVTAAADG